MKKILLLTMVTFFSVTSYANDNQQSRYYTEKGRVSLQNNDYENACSEFNLADNYAVKAGAPDVVMHMIQNNINKACRTNDNSSQTSATAQQYPEGTIEKETGTGRDVIMHNDKWEYKQTQTQQQTKEMSTQEAMQQVAGMMKLLNDPFGLQPCINYKAALQYCAAAGDIDRCISIKLQIKSATVRKLEQQCEQK